MRKKDKCSGISASQRTHRMDPARFFCLVLYFFLQPVASSDTLCWFHLSTFAPVCSVIDKRLIQEPVSWALVLQGCRHTAPPFSYLWQGDTIASLFPGAVRKIKWWSRLINMCKCWKQCLVLKKWKEKKNRLIATCVAAKCVLTRGHCWLMLLSEVNQWFLQQCGWLMVRRGLDFA